MLEFPAGVSSVNELLSASPSIVTKRVMFSKVCTCTCRFLSLNRFIAVSLKDTSILGSTKISSHSAFNSPFSKENVFKALLGVGIVIDAYKAICPFFTHSRTVTPSPTST